VYLFIHLSAKHRVLGYDIADMRGQSKLLRNFDFQVVDPKAGFNSPSHGTFLDKTLLVRVTESASGP
jgi:hypothetical protein